MPTRHEQEERPLPSHATSRAARPRPRGLVRAIVAGVLALSFLAGGRATSADEPSKDDPLELFMPDGQLVSHPIRVYVKRRITQDMAPALRLSGSYTLTTAEKDDGVPQVARFVFTDQEWTIPLPDGTVVSRRGTLLLFDLKGARLIPWYKAMSRMTPIVSWVEQQDGMPVTRLAIGEREVNLGRTGAAWAWTALIVAMALALIVLLGWRSALDDDEGFSPQSLLVEDQRYSLARTQIAIWTVAIGTVILFYGLVRLSVPSLPATLIVLMGMSLATGGLRYVAKPPQVTGAAPPPGKPRLSDLISDVVPGSATPVLSVARAQMLFWTVIVVFLFVSKSALDGVLWDVPSELVALMGLSQAGYLLPKFNFGQQNDAPGAGGDAAAGGQQRAA